MLKEVVIVKLRDVSIRIAMYDPGQPWDTKLEQLNLTLDIEWPFHCEFEYLCRLSGLRH